jgi:DNA-binding NtrC family response regulator
MLARLIHQASPRQVEPYMVVDCGALSEHLIESEIFGHVRGAFTGAERDRPGKFTAAGSGTLVLDEINSLPLPLQAKLLRAVEDRVFEPVGSNRSEKLRARLIAVSNVPLEDEVRRERFRSDLYYRLNVVELRLPPLRERRDAIVPLAYKFLREGAASQSVTGIASTALAAMVEYSWPGNVRELRNVIERAVALTSGSVIQLADLPTPIRDRLRCPGQARATPVERPAGALDHDECLEDGYVGDECALLIALLNKHRNNRRRTAEELGVSRMTLYKKLHKHGIFVPKSKSGILRSGDCNLVGNSSNP